LRSHCHTSILTTTIDIITTVIIVTIIIIITNYTTTCGGVAWLRASESARETCVRAGSVS
jgi:hypothetical protein